MEWSRSWGIAMPPSGRAQARSGSPSGPGAGSLASLAAAWSSSIPGRDRCRGGAGGKAMSRHCSIAGVAVHARGIVGESRASAIGDADACEYQAFREWLPDLTALTNAACTSSPLFANIGSLFSVGSSRACGGSTTTLFRDLELRGGVLGLEGGAVDKRDRVMVDVDVRCPRGGVVAKPLGKCEVLMPDGPGNAAECESACLCYDMCIFLLVIDRLEFGCGEGGGGVARHARCQLHYVLHCPPIGNWVGGE
eukprot:3345525-Pyramimonas_sp.AAC.1